MVEPVSFSRGTVASLHPPPPTIVLLQGWFQSWHCMAGCAIDVSVSIPVVIPKYHGELGHINMAWHGVT